MRVCFVPLVVGGFAAVAIGCHQPSIRAKPASPQLHCEPEGIPFYLPKPLLIVSKNFHHIESTNVGLTNTVPIPGGFDDQDEYGAIDFDANYTRQSSSSSTIKSEKGDGDSDQPDVGDKSTGFASKPVLHSAGAPLSPGPLQPLSDGLAPQTFFTYEIVFVPDLTQKYVLEVKGGAGEMRATMNLVNGWMFTGLGPYYLKDSSTAQNIMANGLALNLGLAGVADMITSMAQLRAAEPGKGVDSRDLEALGEAYKRLVEASKEESIDFSSLRPGTIERYAEIYVYEAFLDETGAMQWRPVVGPRDPVTGLPMGLQFDRKFLGAVKRTAADPQAVEDSQQGVTDAVGAISRSVETDSRATARERDPFDIGSERLPGADPSIAQGIINRTLDSAAARQKPKKGHLLDFLHHRRRQNLEQAVEVDVPQ